MDCKTTLRLLEVCRPNGDDIANPELVAATAHLEECPDCLHQFRAHQVFDAHVAAAVQAEPVPAGLSDRIHARLDRVATRRRFLQFSVWSTAAAALVLFAAGFFLWSRHNDNATVIDKAGLAQLQNFLEDFNDRDFDEVLQFKSRDADSQAIARERTELLGQLQLSVRWPQALRLNGLYAVGRTTLFDRPIAVFRFRDPRGHCDILALPQSQFVFTDLEAGMQVIDTQTRNVVLIAWAEEGTTYAAVLKDWSPRDWRPLVESPSRLM